MAGRVVACVPAWNSMQFIGPVLDSLAQQTYADLDILISVDLCDDGTAEYCARFAERHANVRVIRQTRRLGWLGNANALLREARGEFSFFAFHDDPLQPAYVARLAEALEKHPQAVLAFSDLATLDGPCGYDVLDGVSERFERCRRVFHQMGPWWVPNRGLMRMQAVRALGGMRRSLAGEYAADLPWLLRLATLGPFVRVPQTLLFKNLRRTSLSASWRSDRWNRAALKLACMGVIREAGFAPLQELYLYVEMLGIAIGLQRLKPLRELQRLLLRWLCGRSGRGLGDRRSTLRSTSGRDE
jgi:glycosyltransferase involved in cell wall biosynthesis